MGGAVQPGAEGAAAETGPDRAGSARRASPGVRRASTFLILSAGLVAAAACLPLGYLALRAIQIGPDLPRLLFRTQTLRVLTNTVGLAAAVTLSASVIGLAMAWLTLRTDLPGRRWWSTVTLLPLVLPSYVGAFALVGALGPTGMLQSLLQPLGVERLPSIYGFPGAWLALTLFTYPYVQLSVRAGFRGLDPSLEDAARTMGCSRGRVFREITLPHLRPALHAGALLVALYTLSDFGAVSLLQFNAFTRAIYVQYTAAFDRNTAALLAVLLVAITGLILHIEVRMRGQAVYHRSGIGTQRRPVPIRLGPWRVPALFFVAAVTLLALGVPVAVVTYWLVRGLRAGETLAPHARLLYHSLLVSAQTGLAAAAAAFPVVFYAVRHPGRMSRAFERCAWMSHAVPGIAVALALVFFGIRVVPLLYQSLAMLVFACTLLFLPLAIGSLRTSMLQLTPRMEEAARTLGRTPRGILFSVTLPLLRPGVCVGFALVFLHTMKELPATLLLGPTGFQTLATRIWSATEEAFFARAAAPALILIPVSALSLWILFAHEEAWLDA